MARGSRKAKGERPRGDAFGLGLEVLRYIAEAPRQPGEIAAAFGVSRRTVERILRTAEAHGLEIQVSRRGRGAWYELRAAGWNTALLPRSAPGRAAAQRGKGSR
jgi:DNA-binding IclR family transcriptional regulator